MRKLCLLLIAIAFMPCGQAASVDADPRAIRDLVAQYMRARNAKDPGAIPRLFTSDADQLVSTGEWRKGLDNLVRGTTASSHQELGKSSIDIENIRLIAPDVAIVDGRYQTTSLNGTVRKMWTTLIVKRTQDGWRITAIRNMLPTGPGATH
jgi:uncharacterized protein (TIGR02246 family)